MPDPNHKLQPGEPPLTGVGSGPPRWMVPVVVVALGLVAVAGALGRSGRVIGDGVDLYGTFWFYWWIDHCLRTLTDPSFTDMMFYPLGKDIFAHTGNNFVDAVLAWPLQAVLPYPGYQPVWVAVLLIGNGLTFWPLARHVLGKRSWAAFLATTLWTIHPFVLFECMTGRLTQALVWWLPLAILGFLRTGEAAVGGGRWSWSTLRWPVLMGLMTGLSAWTYWFQGYFMVLGFAWLAAVRLARPEGRRRSDLLVDWLIAGLVCLLVVTPGMLAMASAADTGAVPGLSEDTSGFFELPRALGNNVSQTLHGLVLMERHGQPQLTTFTWTVAALVGLVAGRNRWMWIGLAAVIGAFSIGPVWPGADGESTRMFHYLAAYRLVPFFDRLWFPYRMVVVAFLGLTLAVASAFARLEGLWAAHPKRVAGVALLALGVAAAEQHRHLALPLVSRDLTPPPVMATLGQVGGGLIELPVGLARVSIAWQPVHAQPTFGGMAENARLFWPEGFDKRLSNRFIRFLKGATVDPDQTRTFKAVDVLRFKAEGFRWVVLDRHLVDANLHNTPMWRRLNEQERLAAPFRVQAHLVEHLGPPAAVDGSLVVWDLAGWTADGLKIRPTTSELAPFAPTSENLRTRTWAMDDMPAYEQHLMDQGRIPDPRGGR